jgi:uncharacterized repeat protein (TIGR03803 family)
MKTSNFRHRRAAALWLPLVVFAFMPLADGQTFEVLQSVSASLTQGRDGKIYGTTSETLFKLAANGALTTLASISNATNGLGPMGQGSDGNFYGTTVAGGDRSLNNGIGFGTVFKMTTNGMVTTLFTFRNDSNGMYPQRLVLGSDNSFYGTTQGSQGSIPYGTVFKITTDGTLTTLARFNKSNGAYPQAALVQGSDGAFYGTTQGGGSAPHPNSPNGYGTVFKITTNGVLTTLVSFDGSSGWACIGSLVQGTDGNFYGDLGLIGPGSVFQMTPTGDLTTLAWFNGGNGADPWAGLVQAGDGNFYGTTRDGGNLSLFGGVGGGTVFKMTPDGTLTTLVSFDRANGALPEAALIKGSDGNLYGTTFTGITNGVGTIFRIVMPPPPPTLTIAQDGNQVVLSWPTNDAGFVLEAADSLSSSATWSTNSDTPIIIGDQNTITVSNPAGIKFYRLQK